MDTASLERLGLTKSEIKVYLALLDLGTSSVGPITRKSGVASSKTYELLEKLMEKGLITTHIEHNRKFFSAVNPRRLIDFLEKKKDDLAEVDTEMKQVIPSLIVRYEQHAGESNVEVFKGYRGVETVFHEMIGSLRKGDEFLVMGGGDTPSANQRTKAFFEKIHRRRAEKGIIFRVIFSEARRKSLKQMALFPHTLPRYLHYGTPSTVNIYNDTTILLVMSPEPAAIRIQNKNITDSYRTYFEQMWRSAKK